MTKLEHPLPVFPKPVRDRRVTRVSPNGTTVEQRTIIDECAVAIVLNGTTVAVMMASPVDIAEFALGFAVSEGYIRGSGDVEDFEIVAHGPGIEARFWVSDPCADALKERRRAMLGPIGCGLCGIESLEAAIRSVTPVESALRLPASAIQDGFAALSAHQHLHNATRSCHAAGFITPNAGFLTAREDVGRHNALDKLIGSLLTAGTSPADGAILMTSRISVELVQKAASVGCSILCGISGPSGLAVSTAEQANVTLIGFQRGGGFDVFSGPERILLD